MKTVCHVRPVYQCGTPGVPVVSDVVRPVYQGFLTSTPRVPVSLFFLLSLVRPVYTLKALPRAKGSRRSCFMLLMPLIHRSKGLRLQTAFFTGGECSAPLQGATA